MANKPPMTKRTWVRSASSTMKNAAKEIVVEIMPNLSQSANSAVDGMKEIKNVLQRSRTSITQQHRMMERTSIGREVKSLFKDAKEDIKAGNFHQNQLEHESALLGDMSFEDDVPTDEKDNYEAGYSPSSSINAIAKLNSTMAASNSATISSIKSMTSTLANVQMKSHQALASTIQNANISQTNILSSGLERIYQQLEISNRYNAAMMEFMNKNISPTNQQMIEVAPMINDKLDKLIETVKSMNHGTVSKDTQAPQNVMDLIVGDGSGINFRELAKHSKNRFFETQAGMALSMLGSMRSMGGSLRNSFRLVPMLSKFGLSAALGKSTRDKMKNMDEEFSFMLRSMLYGLGDSARNGTGSRARQLLGKLFGVDRETIKKLDLSTGRKDEVIGWNGIAQKTLVEVIPGLLSSMEAAITKSDRKIFDYRSGTFMTEKELAKSYMREQQAAASTAAENTLNALVTMFTKSGIGEKAIKQMASQIESIVHDQMRGNRSFDKETKSELHNIMNQHGVNNSDINRVLHELEKTTVNVVSSLNAIRQGIMDERADYQSYRMLMNNSGRKSKWTRDDFSNLLPNTLDITELKAYSRLMSENDIIDNLIENVGNASKSGKFMNRRNARDRKVSRFMDMITEATYERFYGGSSHKAAESRATREARIDKSNQRGGIPARIDPNRISINTNTDTDIARINGQIMDGYSSGNQTTILQSLAMDIHSKMLVPMYANFFSKDGILKKFFSDDPNSEFNKLKERLFGKENGIFTPLANWLKYKFTGKGYTAKNGTVYEDTEDSVFGRGKSAYNKGFKWTMQYLFGDEYESSEGYQDFFYKLSPEAFAARKERKRLRKEQLKREAEQYAANKAASVGNGRRRRVGYGRGQSDPRWANYALGTFADGSLATMDLAGCGPTALAFIAANAGKNISPLDVAKFAKSNGYISDGGANADLFESGASSLGLNGKRIGISSIRNSLSRGRSIIVSGKSLSGNSIYSPDGHIVSVIPSGDGKNAIVYDPADGSQKLISLRSLKSGARNAWSYNVGYANKRKRKHNRTSSQSTQQSSEASNINIPFEAEVVPLTTDIASAVPHKNNLHVVIKDIENSVVDTLVKKFWTYQKKIAPSLPAWNGKSITYVNEKGKNVTLKSKKAYDAEFKRLAALEVNRPMDTDPFDFLNVIRRQANAAHPLYEKMASSLTNIYDIDKSSNRFVSDLRAKMNSSGASTKKIETAVNFFSNEIKKDKYHQSGVTQKQLKDLGTEIVSGMKDAMLKDKSSGLSDNEIQSIADIIKASLLSFNDDVLINNQQASAGYNINSQQPTIIVLNNGASIDFATSKIINTDAGSIINQKKNEELNDTLDALIKENIAEINAAKIESNQTVQAVLNNAATILGVNSNGSNIISGLNAEEESQFVTLLAKQQVKESKSQGLSQNQKKEYDRIKSKANPQWVTSMEASLGVNNGAAIAISRTSEAAEEIMDMALGDSDSYSAKFKKSTSEFFKNLKAKTGSILTGGAAGAIIGGINGTSGGFLTSLFLPTGPIGGAIAGVGLSLLARNEKFKDFMFGKEEDGKRTGGLISKDLQTSFKKSLPYAVGGATVGVLKNIVTGALGISGNGVISNALLGTGPIGAAIIGAGIGILKNNERFQNMLFGEKGEDGKYDGGKLSKIMNKLSSAYHTSKDFIKGGIKGLGVGALASSALGQMGIIGGALSVGGPIGGALAGLGIGIASNTERFRRLLFGTAEYDEEGNLKGRRKDGLLHRTMNSFIQEGIYPAKDAIIKNTQDFGIWSQKNIVLPFKEAFGPIADSLAALKVNLSDTIQAGFEKISGGVGDVLTWGINMIKHPLKTSLKTVANLGSKAIFMQAKLMGGLISAPLKLLAFTQRRKRNRKEDEYARTLQGDIEEGLSLQDLWRADDENGKYDGRFGRARRLFGHGLDIINRFAGNGRLRRWTTHRFGTDDDVTARSAFGQGMEELGMNKLGWFQARAEFKKKKRDYKLEENRRDNFNDVQRELAKWAREDKHVEDRQWTPALFNKRRKVLEGMGIIAGGINSVDDIKELMYHRGAWQKKWGLYGDEDLVKEQQLREVQNAEDTKEYQADVRIKFDEIIELLKNMGEQAAYDDIARRDETNRNRRYYRLKKEFYKFGIDEDDVLSSNIDLDDILGMNQDTWDEYSKYGGGNFDEFAKKHWKRIFKHRYANKDEKFAESYDDYMKTRETAYAGSGRGIGYGSGLFTPAGHIVSIEGAVGNNVIVNDPATGRQSLRSLNSIRPELTNAWAFDRSVGYGLRSRITSRIDVNSALTTTGQILVPFIEDLVNKFLPESLAIGINSTIDEKAGKIISNLKPRKLSKSEAFLQSIAHNTAIMAGVTVGKSDDPTSSVGYGSGFAQGDSRWGKIKLGRFKNGSVATMDRAGCGPTALTNVANQLTGSGYNPGQIGLFAKNNGYISDGGANAALFDRGARALGLNSKRISTSSILSRLKNGEKIIVSGKSGGSVGYGSDIPDSALELLAGIYVSTQSSAETLEDSAIINKTEDDIKKEQKIITEAAEREQAQALGGKNGAAEIKGRPDGIGLDKLFNKMIYTKDGEKRSGIFGSILRNIGSFGSFITGDNTLGKLALTAGLVLFKEPIGAAIDAVKEYFPKALSYIGNTIVPAAFNGLGTIVQYTIQAIPSVLSGAWTGIKNLGSYFSENMGIISGKSKTYSTWKGEVDLVNGVSSDGTALASYINEYGEKVYATNSRGEYLSLGRNQYIDSDGSIGKIQRGKGFGNNMARLAANSMRNPAVAAKSARVLGAGLRATSIVGKHIPIANHVFKATDNLGKRMMKTTVKSKASYKAAQEASKKAYEKAVQNLDALGRNTSTRSMVATIAKDKANGLLKKLASGIQKGISKISKLIGDKNSSKLLSKITNVCEAALSKADDTVCRELCEQAVGAGAKTAARAFGWMLTPIFMIADGIKGYKSAEELFDVPAGEADGKMKLISSAINVILGLGVGPLFDIFCVFVASVTGVDLKKDAALAVYRWIAGEEKYEEVQEKQKVLEIELANYNLAHEGAELTMAEYTDLKAESKSAWNKVKNFFGGGIKEDFTKYSASEAQIKEAGLNYTKNAAYNVTNNYYNVNSGTFEDLVNESVGNGVGYGAGYAQNDPRWAKVPLGKFKNGQTATMDLAGCGPTALTNVANQLTGSNYNPAQIAGFARKNGYISDGGANAGLFENGARALGMRSTKIPTSSIIKRLNNGEKIIVSGKSGNASIGYGSGLFTPAGHIVSLEGAVGNNVLVNDPQTGRTSLHSIESIKPELTNAWAMHKRNVGFGRGLRKYGDFAVGYGPATDLMIRTGNATPEKIAELEALEKKVGSPNVTSLMPGIFASTPNPQTSTKSAIDAYFKYYKNRDIANQALDPSNENYYSGLWYDQISSYMPTNGLALTIQDFFNLSDAKKGGDASLLQKSFLYAFLYDELKTYLGKDGKDAQGHNRLVNRYLDYDFLSANGIKAYEAWQFANSSGLNPWNNSKSISGSPYGIMYGIPYYYMQDSRWASMKWKNNTVGESGDDLTALAMILTAYSGANGSNLAITPKYILENWLANRSDLHNSNGFTNKFFTKDGMQLMQETYDENGKPLQIRSGRSTADVINAMKNHQLVLMNGAQFSNSPFGGVGELNRNSLKYHTVVGAYAGDGMFAVVDPNQSANAHLIFSEDMLNTMIPTTSNGILNKSLIFSKSDGGGVSSNANFTNPITSSSQWQDVLSSYADDEFGAIKSIFGGLTKIVTNFISSIFGGTSYKSIYDEGFSEEIATGVDTSTTSADYNVNTNGSISYIANQTISDSAEVTATRKWNMLTDKQKQNVIQGYEKGVPFGTTDAENAYFASNIYPSYAAKDYTHYNLSEYDAVKLDSLWNGLSDGDIIQYILDFKKKGSFYSALLAEDKWYGTNKVGYVQDKVINPWLDNNPTIKQRIGYGTGNTLSSMRDYYGKKVTDILSGKYRTASDTNTSTTGAAAALPAGSIPMTSGNRIGDYVKQFESGNKGSAFVSSGTGDAGGRSFGTYQFASMGKDTATGNLAGFWNKYYASRWPNVKPGANDQFVSAWQTEANRDPEGFQKNEWQYVFDNYYKPFRSKHTGILNPDLHSRALQETFWSTAVQYGPNSSVLKKALNEQNSQHIGVSDLINTIQDYKTANIAKNFASSSSKVQASVRNRHNKSERAALLAIRNLAPLSGVGGENDVLETSATGETNGLNAFLTGLTNTVGKYINSRFGGVSDISDNISGLSPITSNFVSGDGNKTNIALVEFARALKELGAGYVWGGRCRKYTYVEKEYLKKTYACNDWPASKYEYQYTRYQNKIVTDCSGILRGYLGKGSTANNYYHESTNKGPIGSLPKTTPGILVFRYSDKTGTMVHVGITTGSGTVIHAKGTKEGVIEESISSSKWTHWAKCNYITYVTGSPNSTNVTSIKNMLNVANTDTMSTTKALATIGYGKGSNPIDYLVDSLGGIITQNVGYGITPNGAITRHRGTDIAALMNTPIPSPVSGTVVANHNVGYGSDYGNYVVVKDSSGKKHLMAHMSSPSGKSVGSHVSQGDVLGYVGSTGKSSGPHLHYEIRDNDGIIDPMSDRINRARQVYGKRESSKLNLLDATFDDNLKNDSPTGGQDDILNLTNAISSANSVDEIVDGLNNIIVILKSWANADAEAKENILSTVTANANTSTVNTVNNNSPVTINQVSSNKTSSSNSQNISDMSSRSLHEMIAKKRPF